MERQVRAARADLVRTASKIEGRPRVPEPRFVCREVRALPARAERAASMGAGQEDECTLAVAELSDLSARVAERRDELARARDDAWTTASWPDDPRTW